MAGPSEECQEGQSSCGEGSKRDEAREGVAGQVLRGPRPLEGLGILLREQQETIGPFKLDLRSQSKHLSYVGHGTELWN